MKDRLARIVLWLALAALPCALHGQQVASTMPVAVPSSAEVAAVIAREFGPNVKILTNFQPVVLDLDGDGLEDLAVAVSTSVVTSEAASYDFKVVAPYAEFFGSEDSSMAMNFGSDTQVRFIAVLHDWRAAKPKAKFLIVGVPFERLSAGAIKVKKKKQGTIVTVERSGSSSALYFDGKKYRWLALEVESSPVIIEAPASSGEPKTR